MTEPEQLAALGLGKPPRGEAYVLLARTLLAELGADGTTLGLRGERARRPHLCVAGQSDRTSSATG